MSPIDGWTFTPAAPGYHAGEYVRDRRHRDCVVTVTRLEPAMGGGYELTVVSDDPPGIAPAPLIRSTRTLRAALRAGDAL